MFELKFKTMVFRRYSRKRFCLPICICLSWCDVDGDSTGATGGKGKQNSIYTKSGKPFFTKRKVKLSTTGTWVKDDQN
jgi:hypothetical protein